MLRIEKLRCFRNDTVLFKPFTLHVEPHQLYVLCGENGVGKTTALRAAAGLYSDIDGVVTCAPHITRRFVGHENALLPHLSVENYLEHMARMQGGSALSIKAAMHFFALTPYAQKPIHTLSRGWKRKLALARLMVSPGHVWLLDEPFANIDPTGQEALTNLMAVHCDQGGAVIITSPTHANPLSIGTEMVLEAADV